jgi:hypothetical protein
MGSDNIMTVLAIDQFVCLSCTLEISSLVKVIEDAVWWLDQYIAMIHIVIREFNISQPHR